MHSVSKRSTILRRCAATSALTLLAGFAGAARAQEALPVGGAVTSGAATISGGAGTVTVDQTSARAIVNWQSFDVGAGNTVVFNQPDATAATLNRVTGGTSSTIAGQIVANGAVYLVNPNGIAITSTGSVQTGGGFVASTLDLADADFAGGKLRFAGTGVSKGVSNAGTITAGAGGYVALLGGTVSNAGTISVPLGRVALGAGERIALDLNGGGFLQVALPSDVAGTLIASSGSIAAAGGRIELKAATAQDVVRGVVNVSGSLSADSASGNAGSIVLLGGDGGTVNATGTLTARATGATGDGGFVETSGATVNFAGVTVDTRAANGAAGTWLIDPADIVVDAPGAATISGNLATGNVTLATGSDTAVPGNGDILVNSAINWTSANTLTLQAYRNIALNAAITGTAGGLTLTAGNDVFFAGAVTATGAVNVRLFNLTNGNWSQIGALPAFGATDFRFDVNKANFVRATGGTGAAGSAYIIADVYGLQGIASKTLLNRSFTLANNIDASGTSAWNSGLGFVAIGTDGNGAGTGFNGSFNGGNFAIAGLRINRTAAMQGLFGYVDGMASLTNTVLTGGSVGGSYYVGALVGIGFGGTISGISSSVIVTATGTQVGGLIGGVFGASVSASSASGIVIGASNNVGGLIGLMDAGSTVTGSSATGNVTGSGNNVGGLVGYQNQPGSGTSSIANSFATGTVRGASYVGGLVGLQRTSGGGRVTITGSYATGAVVSTITGDNLANAGGLVGSIQTSAPNTANMRASIGNSYATGAVSSQGGNIGGLVGSATNVAVNDKTITIGITNAYATGAVSSQGGNVGGLVGYMNGYTTLDSVYATGSVGGYAVIGGLVGRADANGAISSAYASGRVTGGGNIGGLVGSLNSAASLTNAYWDSYSTARGAAVGGGTAAATVTAVTSDPAQSAASNYAYKAGAYAKLPPASGAGTASATGFAFMPGDSTRPFLAFEVPASGSTIVNSHQLQLIGYDTTRLAGSYTLGRDIDLDETRRVVVGTPDSYAGMWAGTGFVAIGTDGNNNVIGSGYTGGFAGGGFTIGNLTINRTANYQGLFGVTSGASTIDNVRLAGGSVTGGNFVGGLIGYATGTVTRSSVSIAVRGTNYVGGLVGEAGTSTAAITGSSASGMVIATDRFAGGLVGLANGPIATSFATGSVTGVNYVGGLAGNITSASATIDQTYATGAVVSTGTGATYAGGLVGYYITGSTLARSYATGSVTANSTSAAIGGLVGYSQATITQSYATGRIGTAGQARGGLVGQIAGGSVAASDFWDSYSTGVTTAVGIGTPGGVPVRVTSNPAEAQAPNYAYKTSVYTGTGGLTAADWVFFDGQTRPFGAWEVVAPGGTITTSHQLQLIGANAATLAGSYTLGGNIDLTETGGVVASTPSYAGMWAGTGFVSLGTNGAGLTWDGTTYRSIGTITSGTYGYSGTFDGGGYALSNLFINRINTANTGLFGTVSGTIRNVTVGGSVTGGNGTGGLVGMLIGGPTTSTTGLSPVVSNARSTVNVTGLQVVGGLVGSAGQRSSVLNGTASGTVNGTNTVGGLIGSANRATVSGSASGAVSGQGYVGGLIGQQFAGTTTGYATGAVTGTIAVGGLIGVLDGSATERGTATATRSAQSTSGPVTADRNFGRVSAGGTATTQPAP